MSVGERIRMIRMEEGMTQAVFAKAVGMTAKTVSGLEDGSIEMTRDKGRAICNRFCVRLNWLMTGEGERSSISKDMLCALMLSEMAPDALITKVATILTIYPSLNRALQALVDAYSDEDFMNWNKLLKNDFLMTVTANSAGLAMVFVPKKEE